MTTFEYEEDGQYSQDAAIGQPLTVTDSNGHVTHFRYDGRARKTSLTDAEGNSTEFEYNLADQTTETTLPATGQTGQGNARIVGTFQYPGGPLASTTRYDESNNLVRTVTFTYGAAGELLSRTGSAEAYAQEYDAAYRVISFADGEENATTYTYDTRGDLLEVEYPNEDTVTFAGHDEVGRVGTRTDGNGLVTSYTYGDEAGLLTAIAYTDHSSQNVGLTYDDYGRLTQRSDAAGTESFTYDDLGSVLTTSTTYTGLAAKTLTYSYFADGSRDELDTPGGTFEYDYDAAGRLVGLDGPAGSAAWDYLDNNWLSEQTLPNGFVTRYTHNAWGLLEGLENEDDNTTTLSEFDEVEYDGVGNLTSVTSAGIAAGVTDYTYDSKDQLTNETTTRGDDFDHTFAYDDAGNPTTFAGDTRTYNEANQRTGQGFAYDDNGNPTTYNAETLTYDVENRLTAYGDDLTAGYRGDGKRAWKEDSQENRTYYLYDGDRLLAALDDDGAVIATLSWGAAGLFAYGSTQYQFDLQGSVVARTSSIGSVLSTHWYDAHGTEQTTPSSEPFGYKGRYGYYTDRETGLILCTHRYLDPAAGRWLTRDPIGVAGGVNIYSYCMNQVVLRADPTGWDSATLLILYVILTAECAFLIVRHAWPKPAPGSSGPVSGTGGPGGAFQKQQPWESDEHFLWRMEAAQNG